MTEEKKDFFVSDISLRYQYTAGHATTRFLNKVAEGKLVAQKCPKCTAVYVPPRGSCPGCGVATEEELELTKYIYNNTCSRVKNRCIYLIIIKDKNPIYSYLMISKK